MRVLGFLLGCLVLLGGPAQAIEVYGIELPASTTLAGKKLQLNGYGLRKKFFFKIYLGSLYTENKATSSEEVLNQPGPKLIRMDYIYSKVAREKIVEAFAEGFEKNSPELALQPSVNQFLTLFDADFKAGDRVDLQLTADTVRASHNGRPLGSVRSPELVRGVLLIYLGRSPADKGMKTGMLGGI